MKTFDWLLLLGALALGLALALVDSSPGWDDTGMSAVAVLAAAAAFGAARPGPGCGRWPSASGSRHLRSSCATTRRR